MLFSYGTLEHNFVPSAKIVFIFLCTNKIAFFFLHNHQFSLFHIFSYNHFHITKIISYFCIS